MRERIARLVNAGDPSRIALTLNATDALNIAIKGCLRKGDHVVTTLAEHFSVIRPLASLEQSEFIRVTRVRPKEDGGVAPEDIAKAINAKTRLIAVTHCSTLAFFSHTPANCSADSESEMTSFSDTGPCRTAS